MRFFYLIILLVDFHDLIYEPWVHQYISISKESMINQSMRHLCFHLSNDNRFINTIKSVPENNFCSVSSGDTGFTSLKSRKEFWPSMNNNKKWHNSEVSAKMAENKRRKNRFIMHFLVVFRGWNFKKSERKRGEKLKNRKKREEQKKKGKN